MNSQDLAGVTVVAIVAAAIVAWGWIERPVEHDCPRTVTHVRTISTPALSLHDGVWIAERRIAVTTEPQP